jgi:cysteine desulfurase
MKNASDIIYLDNNATTPIAPEVFEAMVPYLTEYYGNPSSAYTFGTKVSKALATAREQVCGLFNCDPKELIFTSCGTESDNAAIWSTLQTTGKKHIITTQVEHSAIKNFGEYLEERGYIVTWLPVDSQGMLDLKDLERAFRPDTAIVSTMWANNETGVLFPVEEIGEMCRSRGVMFHTDAVQTPGKIPIDLKNIKADFVSFSGHKLHAPKGIGALYIKRRTKFVPYVIGGGQERGKRGGTENVASIIGFGRAAELAKENLIDEQTRVRSLRDKLEKGLEERLTDIYINGKRDQRLPNTTNIAFDFVEAESILMMLDQKGICCSSGSACTTGSLDPSHVLSAMGLTPARARGCVRFSLSHYNTEADVDKALEVIPPIIKKLREISPLNPNHRDNFSYDVEAAREKEEKLMAETMSKINE